MKDKKFLLCMRQSRYKKAMREIQFIAYNSKDLFDTIMRYSVASKYDKLATSCIVLICHFSKKNVIVI